jgi:hypothetical protein
VKFLPFVATRRARHAATQVKEIDMHQPDVLPLPLTQADAEYVAERAAGAAAEAARLRSEGRSALALADIWDDIATTFRSRLSGPVSLMPPAAPPPGGAEPDPQPLEAEAFAAAVADGVKHDPGFAAYAAGMASYPTEAKPQTGRAPYPSPTQPMPRVDDAVQLNGTYPSEPMPGGVR